MRKLYATSASSAEIIFASASSFVIDLVPDVMQCIPEKTANPSISIADSHSCKELELVATWCEVNKDISLVPTQITALQSAVSRQENCRFSEKCYLLWQQL